MAQAASDGRGTVFFDVDTQVDFMLPVGALYVPGAEHLIPALARLAQFARERRIPVISTADAHAPRDPEFQQWPPHCVAGTLGQQKVAETLSPGAVTIPNTGEELPPAWEKAPQVIVEKQTLDAFRTHTLSRVLEQRRGSRFVVYGVVTEYCVLCAAQGLLSRGEQIDIVTDAIRAIDSAQGRKVLDDLQAAGARLVSVDEVLAV